MLRKKKIVVKILVVIMIITSFSVAAGPNWKKIGNAVLTFISHGGYLGKTVQPTLPDGSVVDACQDSNDTECFALNLF